MQSAVMCKGSISLIKTLKTYVSASSNVLTVSAAQVLTGQRSAGSEQRILHVIQNIVDSDVWRGDNPRVLNP